MKPRRRNSSKKSHVYRRIARRRSQATQTVGPPWPLRQRIQRPRDTRAYKNDKLAPPHRFPAAEMFIVPFRLARLRRVQAIAGGVS
jgi:hypothetical protein